MQPNPAWREGDLSDAVGEGPGTMSDQCGGLMPWPIDGGNLGQSCSQGYCALWDDWYGGFGHGASVDEVPLQAGEVMKRSEPSLTLILTRSHGQKLPKVAKKIRWTDARCYSDD